MSIAEKRKKLHQIILHADETLVDIMDAVSDAYQQAIRETSLTETQRQELEKRWLKYKRGESKTYSWQSISSLATKELRKIRSR